MANDRSFQPPAAPALPLEVFGNIIGHLNSCPDALRACSLVCRGWTTYSQSHIFQTFAFLCTPAPNPQITKAVAFFTEATHLAAYVHNITLLLDQPTNDDLPALLKLFPWVKSMHVAGIVIWHLLPASLQVSISSTVKLPTLTSLTLTKVSFHTSQDFESLLGDGAETLRSLDLVGVMLHANPARPYALPRLSRLRLHEHRDSYMASQVSLPSIFSAPALQILERSFHLHPRSTADVNLPPHAHCITILKLIICLNSWYYANDGWPITDVSTCTSLRDLHLRVTDDDQRYSTHGLKWIAEFLGKLPCPGSLESVHLVIPTDRGIPMDLWDKRGWTHLKDVLAAHAAHGTLRLVTIALERIRGSVELETAALLRSKFSAETIIARQVRQEMQQLSASLTLRVRFVDAPIAGVF
ncbi:hypothetical protein HGRIS_014121 [Hohenbuehelia grisea]|uniref:F-box domain-containing protein n=1 Tax=Hohenbuehelia grisea TaxID=104357 RepID=A0ABR3JSM7_9AGAR